MQRWKSRVTYTGELDAAVAALGSSAALLDVKKTERAAGSLDNPRQVRRGVVAARKPELALSSSRRRCLYRFSINSGDKKTRRTHGFRRR